MSLDKEKVSQELKVLKRIQETEDTISLVLEVPRTTGGRFQYKAGQFVTLFMEINGEEVRRSYSLASSPDIDTEFKISVKLVPGGKGSTFLIESVKEGDKLWVTPPAGHFCLPKDLVDGKLGFYAAGSGITPIISLIKTALKTSRAECALLYQNRRGSNVIFKDELAKLVEEYDGRLKITHILSQPDSDWQGLKGRADARVVRDFLTDNSLGMRTLHYICGPNDFMNAVETALTGMSVEKTKIIKESFTVVAAPPPASARAGADLAAQAEVTVGAATTSTIGADSFELDEEAVVIGARAQLSKPESIEATIDGELHKLPYKKDKTILECLLDAGLNPPYSCLDGACMACIAKVQDGLVYQNDMGILTEDNVDAGECLTCQARPASKNVKVNYEIF